MRIVLTIALYGILILQTVLVPTIRIAGAGPDLLLIALVYWTLGRNRIRNLAAGFLVGLLQDMAGPGPLGIFALSKSVSCYAIGSITTDRPVEAYWLWSLVLLLAAMVHESVAALFLAREAAAGALGLLLRHGLPSAFYTAVLGAAIRGSILAGKWIRVRRA